MSGLDQEKMKQFMKPEGYTDVTQVTKSSGISSIFSGAIIDDFQFDPIGYSMNGMMGEYYFTIHITPNLKCSYVSFETNFPCKNYTALIQQVLTVFKPSTFTLSLFANEVSSNIYGLSADSAFERIENCQRSEEIDIEFESYKLAFCRYTKKL